MIYQERDPSENSPPKFWPDWLDYVYETELDQQLVKDFQAMFRHLDDDDKRLLAILRIWRSLINRRRLLISKHPDGLEAMTRTYLWLTTDCLQLTPPLIQAVRQYCQRVERERTQKIRQYLDLIEEHNKSSQDYQHARRYLTFHVENLLVESDAENPNLQAVIELAHWVPRIALFEPGRPNLATSLARWIKTYQRWRIRDLNIPDRNAPISLNIPLGFDDSDATEHLEQIPDGAQPWAAPTLNDLMQGNLIDQRIHQEESNAQKERAKFIETYINTDPDGRLQANYPDGYPNCHYQLLAQRLFLKEPPDTIRAIANEFQIKYEKLYAVVAGKDSQRNSLYLLLPALLIEAYPDPSALKQAIQDDANHELSKCSVRNYPECHAQFLAMRRLSLFLPEPRSFEEIAVELQQNPRYEKLKAQQIENHWHNKCLRRIGQLIRSLETSSGANLSGGQS